MNLDPSVTAYIADTLGCKRFCRSCYVLSGRARLIGDHLAEVRVSRTHRRPLRTTTGFEDREDHRNLSTS